MFKVLRVASPFLLAAFFMTLFPLLAHLATMERALGKDKSSVLRKTNTTETALAIIARMPPARIYGATGERSDMQLSTIICLSHDQTCYPYALFEAQDRAKELIGDYGTAGVIVCNEGTPAYEAAIDYLRAPGDESDAMWVALLLVKGIVAAE